MSLKLLTAMLTALPDNKEQLKRDLDAVVAESFKRPTSHHLGLRMAYLRGCAGRYKDTNPALYDAINDYIFNTKYPGLEIHKKTTSLDQTIAYINRIQNELHNLENN